MSTLILEKDADCTGSVETTIAVVTPVLLTLDTKSSVNAIVTLTGALMATLSRGHPFVELKASGDYKIVIVGQCSKASVYISPLLK